MPVVDLKDIRTHLPPRARLMGMDHGSKTIGLAVCNPEMTIATALKTVMRGKFTQDVREIAKLCKEYDVRGFIIGLPLNMDGSEGPRCQSVRQFAVNLMQEREVLGFDPLIAFQDERLSSYAVEQFLIDDFDMSRKKRGDVIDKLAAQNILSAALAVIQSS